MNECPECGGLLIGDVDEDSYSASQEPTAYYCPGWGWSTDLERDDENDTWFDPKEPSDSPYDVNW